jgi:hypothetical protein
MGRSKKQLNDVEILEKENKELKSINKSLKRQMKQENKKYRPEFSKKQLEEEDYKERENICPECGKGRIIETELGPKILVHCTLCKYRKGLKSAQKVESKE